MACQIYVVRDEDENKEEEFDNVEEARFVLCRKSEQGITVSFFSYTDYFATRFYRGENQGNNE